MRAIELLVSSLLLPALGLAYPTEEMKSGGIRLKSRFIVEFDTSLEGSVHKRFIESYDEMHVHHQFDHDLFLGLSFSIEDFGEETIAQLQLTPGVKNVWRSRNLIKRDAYVQPQNILSIWSDHKMTGVQLLHDRNITGRGVVIGMLDSGVNPNHPALKGKILPGYNYCDNTTSGIENNDHNGHGTHCASVAVGSSPDFVGVAPDAKLRMYTLASECQRSASDDSQDDSVMRALLRMYDDKVNLISISIGSTQPFQGSAAAVAVERVSKYIPVVLAAANDGSEGLYTGMDGASAQHAITVGSYESSTFLTWTAKVADSSGNSMNFTYLTEKWVMPTSSYPVEYVEDLCSILNASITGSGKFAMGRVSGNCTHAKAMVRAGEGNFTGCLFLESSKDLSYPKRSASSSIQYAIASADDFLSWIKNSSNSTLTLQFDSNQNYGLKAQQDGVAGVINDFSSWGPTFDQGFYPHIAAPGGDVVVAVTNGTFKIGSGTSFACPYIAGVVALYLSGHPNATSQEVRTKLISTAKMAANNQLVNKWGSYISKPNNLSLAPVLQQGNGYVDLVAFYDLQTSILSAPYLNLNDTKYRVADHTITFKNNGNDTVQYQISHVSYELVYARSSNGTVSSTPPKQEKKSNIVLYSMNMTTLNPGQQASFNVSISAPKGLNQTLGPMFSGAFKITGSNGDLLTVPYLGMEFNTVEWGVWSNSSSVTISTNDNDSVGTQNSSASLENPLIFNDMAYGTPLLSFDLVDVSFDPLTFRYGQMNGVKGYFGPVMVQDTEKQNIIPFPYPCVSPDTGLRSLAILSFSDDTPIPNGRYKILARALNVFGNESNPNDWSLRLTPLFSLKLSNDTSPTTSQTTTTGARSKGGAGTFGVSAGLVFLHLLLTVF